MKKYMSFLLAFLILFLASCLDNTNSKDYSELKKEIEQIETKFQKTLETEGVARAFYLFAADNAVIKRENDTLIIGNEAIKKYYSKEIYSDAVATWKPDYIDISDDGTLAYTFGKYKWSFKDSTGIVTNYEGVFHTVWKKMEDGSWKYVWD